MTTPTDCESIQEELSAALDEGRKLPAATVEHAKHCSECSAFLDLWSGNALELLSRPLPNASIALREKILAMPASSAPAVITRQVERTQRKYRGYVSAAAAAVALGFLGYSLIDIQPAGPIAGKGDFPKGKIANARELAALKSDFRKGFRALRQPTSAIQRVLGK